MYSKRAVTRIQAVIVAIIIIIAAFAVYYVALPPVEEEKVLRVLSCTEDSPDYAPFLLEGFKQFEEETGIKVEGEFVGWDVLHDKITTYLLSGETKYDVVYTNHYWLPEWYQYLEPLDGFLEKDPLTDVDSVAFRKIEGKIYEVALMCFCSFNFYYRTDLFEEAGLTRPPETWDEVLEYAEKLTIDKDGDGTPDQWGLQLELGGRPGAARWNLQELIDKIDGGYYYNFNTEQGRKALQLMIDLMPYTDPISFECTYAGDSALAFAAGDIAMSLQWASNYMILDDPERSNVVGKYAVARTPRIDTYAMAAWLDGYSIPNFIPDDRKELAWEWFKFWGSAEMQAARAVGTGWPVNSINALRRSEVQENTPWADVVVKEIEYGHVYVFAHKNMEEWEKILDDEVLLALHGEKTAEQALKDAYDELVRRGIYDKIIPGSGDAPP